MSTTAPLGNMIIELGLDSANFASGMKGVNQQIKSAMTEMKSHLNIMGRSGDEVDKLKAKQSGLTTVIEAQNKKVVLAKEALDDHKKGLEESGDASQAAKDKTIKLTDEFNKAVGELGSYEDQLKYVRTEIDKLESSSYKVGTSFENIGKKLKTLGDQVHKVGETIYGIGSTLTKTITLPIAALTTGLLKSGIEVQKFRQQASLFYENLYQDTAKAEAQLDSLMTYAKTTPFSYESIVEADQIMQTFGMSTERAAEVQKALGEAVAGTGGSSDDLSSLATIMGQIESSGKLSLQDMNQLVNAKIPAFKIVANELGISVMDLRDAISAGEVTSEEAITALTEGLLKGTDGLNGATVAYEGSLSKVKETLPGAIDSLKSALKNQFSLELVNDENFAKITDSINKFTELLNSGAFAPVVQRVSELIGGLIDKIAQAIEWFNNLSESQQQNIIKFGGFAVAAGPILMIVGKLVSGVGGLVGTFGKMFTSIGGGLKTFASFSSSAGGLSGVFSSVAGFLTGPAGIVLAIGALIAILVVAYNKCEWFRDLVNNAFAKIKEAVLPAIESIKTAFSNIVETLQELWVKIEPIVQKVATFVVENIQSTITFIMNLIGPIVTFIADTVQNISDYISGLIDFVTGIFTGDWDKAWGGLQQIVDSFKNQFQNIIDFIKGIFGAVVTYFGDRFEAVKNFFGDAGAAIGEWTENVGNWFKELPGKIWAAITGVIDSIGQWISDLKSTATQGVSNTVNSIVEFFKNLPGKISSALSNAVTNIVQWVNNLKTTAIQGISNIISSIVNFFAQLPEKIAYQLGVIVAKVYLWITNLITTVQTQVPIIIENVRVFFAELPGKIYDAIISAIDRITEWAISVKDTFVTWITDIITTVIEFFTTLPGKIWDAIISAKDRIVEWGSALIETITTKVSEIITAAINFFTTLPGKIWDAIISAKDKVVDWGSALIETISTKVQEIITAAIDFFKELPGKIWDAIIGTKDKLTEWGSELFTKMKDIGKNLLEGLWNGIVGLKDDIVEKIKGVGASFMDGFKSVLGINSPSTVFAGYGANLMQGLSNGIDANSNGALGALSTVADSLANAFGNNVTSISASTNQLIAIITTFTTTISNSLNACVTVINQFGSSFVSQLNSLGNVSSSFANIFSGLGSIFTSFKSSFNTGTKAVTTIINNFIKTSNNSFSKFKSDAQNVATVMWNAIKNAYSNSTTTIIKSLSSFTLNLKNGFNTLKTTLTSTTISMWSSIKTSFTSNINDLVNKVSELPSKMGNGLKNAGGALKDGLVSIWKTAVQGSAAPVNKAIDGANWILSKFGSNTKIASWSPYAKGTEGHPGGNALVNDGRGAELVQMPNGETFIPRGKNVLIPNAPKGMKVLPAEETAQLMGRKTPTYRYASGIGSLLDNIFNSALAAGSRVKDFALDIWGYIDNPKELINKTLQHFVNYTGVSGIAQSIGVGAVDTAKTAMYSWAEKLYDELGGMSLASYNPSAGVEQWRSTVIRALQMEGLYNDANVTRTLYQMQTESGGNPYAINLWDSNAKKGIPSKGLMQVIDPTFKAYARSGYNSNIWDPISNILASLRYATARYGSLAKAYRGVGYANGGLVTSEQLAWVGEGNKAEMIIPLTNKTRALELIARALSYLGADSTPQGAATSTGSDILINLVQQLLDREDKMVTLLEALEQKSNVISRKDMVDVVDEDLGIKNSYKVRRLVTS